VSGPVFIGIDGGGTRARALVADASGRELARRVGGAGIVRAEDPAAAAATLAELAHAVLAEAHASATDAVLCCALAGAGRDTERDAVRVALTLAGAAAQIVIVGDAEALMTDAFGSDTGVLLVAGTGSIAWARAADGTQTRVGGWGLHLGDEGSGYAIGVATLRAIARAADGRAVATALSAAVLAQLGLAAAGDLIGWAARATKAEIASLAPLALRAAERADRAALDVRDGAVAELVLLATTAARRAGLAQPRIALAGGLIEAGAPLRAAVAAALRVALSGVTLVERTIDGAHGAMLIARQHAV
jgi:N-acetylglucosamine kinase-like BadF-type ATPase